MSKLVVDASVALAWCFPDEATAYADEVLLALEGTTILVPAIWPVEVANAIVVAERRKRITQPDIRRFLQLLEGLTIAEDSLPVTANVSNIVPLARQHRLSAYDTSYLDVALRHMPLATLDRQLERAARATGVEILLGRRQSKPKRQRLQQ